MSVPRSSVFLERQTYRRRRLIDWIKVLPIVGLGLWLVPLLWQTEGEDRVSTADAIIYIFAIWFGLVVAKVISARALKGATTLDRSETDRGRNGQS